MRFFDFNVAYKVFGGTYTASSETANSVFCFDELKYTRWTSSGENSDATEIYVERDFGSARDFDCIFIVGTNIKAPYVKAWNGSSWITPTQTLQSATDLTSHRACFATTQNYQKIRIYGGATIVANAEKQITEIMAFENIGAFNIHPADVQVKRIKVRSKHELDDARYMAFNRGTRFEFTLSLKAHVGQADIDLMETLIDRDMEFYIWINDNQETIFNQKMSPFKFKDVIKVMVDKGDNPEYYKNIFYSGVDNKIPLIEVA